MVILGGWAFLMSEVPLCMDDNPSRLSAKRNHHSKSCRRRARREQLKKVLGVGLETDLDYFHYGPAHDQPTELVAFEGFSLLFITLEPRLE